MFIHTYILSMSKIKLFFWTKVNCKIPDSGYRQNSFALILGDWIYLNPGIKVDVVASNNDSKSF